MGGPGAEYFGIIGNGPFPSEKELVPVSRYGAGTTETAIFREGSLVFTQ